MSLTNPNPISFGNWTSMYVCTRTQKYNTCGFTLWRRSSTHSGTDQEKEEWLPDTPLFRVWSENLKIYIYSQTLCSQENTILTLFFTFYYIPTVMWQFFEFFSAGFFRVYFSYLKILWNFLYDKTLLSVVYLLFMILDHGWNRVKWLEEGVHFHATSRESN